MNYVNDIGSVDCVFTAVSFARFHNIVEYAVHNRVYHPPNPTVHGSFFSGVNVTRGHGPTLDPNFFSGLNIGKRALAGQNVTKIIK